MATTFTILAVFLPVGFMTGIVGQFFKSFALTIAFAVAMSLLVAFTLDPMLSSRFVRYIPPEERMRTRTGRLFERWGRAYEALDRKYHTVLGWALGNPWKTLGAAAVIFIASLSSITVMGTEFVPVEDRGEFQVIVDLPPGTSFGESVAAVSRIEKDVQTIPEVTQVFSTVGINGQVRSSTIRVKTTKKDQRTRGIGAIKAEVRSRLATMAFVDGKVADPRVHAGRALRAADQRLRARRRSRRAAADQQRDRAQGAPDSRRRRHQHQPRERPAEVVARSQPIAGADLGFSVGSVAASCAAWSKASSRPSSATATASTTSASACARISQRPGAILRTPLYSPTAPRCATGDVVAVRPAVGPSNIDREQRRRRRRSASTRERLRARRRDEGVEKAMATIQMPPNFEWGFAGDVELMQESAAALGLALILAVAFIYIVLASQFESFLEPFIIMLSLPLAHRRRAAAAARHRQEPRHAGDDRRGDADGPGDEERHPARRLHEPAAREGLA
jgi:multidrug efflux pump subunit AcrB